MFRYALVLVVLAGCAIAGPFRQRPPIPGLKIVGGRDAHIQDYPYQVSFLYYGYHICGGSIVNEKYVVTAAHCTDGIPNPSSVSVRVGSSILESGGDVIAVKAIHQNPQYDAWNIDYDISVLELETPLKYSSEVGKVGLPDQGQTFADGTLAVVSGWGTTSEGGAGLPNRLQVVEVPLVDLAECQKKYDPYLVTDRMICAGYSQGGKDACQGDSGGPLVIDNTLVGVVSWGLGCARPNYPGVYSNVATLKSYVDSVLSSKTIEE